MDFPLDVLSSMIAFVIVTVGATFQGTIGFGLGPLAVPLLVLINPDFVPGPLLFSALLLTILMSYREYHAIDVKGLKWAVVGRIVGTIIGAALLIIIPRNSLSIMFGIMVLLAVGISMAGVILPITPRNLFGAGTFSGFMGTTAAIGGPPVALLYQNQKGPRLRGTLSAIFVIGTVISLASLAIIGRFGLKEILMGLVLFPGIILGFYLSNRTAEIFDRGFIRPAVLIASAVAGIIVIISSIT